MLSWPRLHRPRGQALGWPRLPGQQGCPPAQPQGSQNAEQGPAEPVGIAAHPDTAPRSVRPFPEPGGHFRAPPAFPALLFPALPNAAHRNPRASCRAEPRPRRSSGPPAGAARPPVLLARGCCPPVGAARPPPLALRARRSPSGGAPPNLRGPAEAPPPPARPRRGRARLPAGRSRCGRGAAGMSEAEGGSAAAVEKPPLPAAGPGAAAAVAAAVAAAAAAAAGPEPGAPAEEAAVVWSPEVEVCLFHAMLGHKPVGVNRHFHMICIRDKFSQNIGRQISSKVIWDHLSTMYDMQALHESEILPFPNIEKNFALPDEMIQEVREGKVMMEEEVKEEVLKEEMETHAGPEEVFAPSGSLGKTTEKPSSKEKEKTSSDPGSKEGSDKRKRNRVTEKVLNANSNPSSPSAAKRRRT